MTNKESMINNLLKVADALDSLGMEDDADYISSIIEKMAEQSSDLAEVETVEEGGQKNIVVNMDDDPIAEKEPNEEEEAFGKEVMEAIFEGISQDLAKQK